MTNVDRIIKIGSHTLNVKGIDDGKSYIVNVFYNNYYIPPSYSYNHTDFINFTNSQESGLFYGTLDEVMDDFIKIIKTDPNIESKLIKIDDYLNKQ